MSGTRELTIALDHGSTTAVVYAPSGVEHRQARDARTLILAHGAGAGQRSPWIVNAARALSALGLQIVTFNFPYTQQKRRLPDRAPILEQCYQTVIGAVRRETAAQRLFIGGKSMGGRIATQVAAADPGLALDGLVLLGYPLHPPGRPQQRRDAHLPAIRVPMLFVQGSRDAFGTPAELAPVIEAVGPHASLHVVDGGDHSFKIGRADAARQAAAFAEVFRAIAEWTARV